MDFKNVVTYGRFKNRVIKTDLWISPQVQRNRLFVSTSSESSINNSSVNKSHPDSAVSVDPERASESSSSEKISSPAESISGKASFKSPSNGFSCKSLSQLASSRKDNGSVLVEHSTPYSGNSRVTVRPRRLPVISPLVITESPLRANGDQFDSPNLFSDTSQEHCDLSANENGDRCITANENEARCNYSANKNEDGHTTANEKRDSCNTANDMEGNFDIHWTSSESSENDLSLKSQISNSSAKSNLELDVKLQKLSDNDIHNISDKMKSLPLNDDDSTGNNSKSNGDISNRSEDKIIECIGTQNLSLENLSSNGHGMCNDVESFSHENLSGNPKVICGGNDGHLDKIGCICTQNAWTNGMENAPCECKCKDFDNSLPDSKNLSTQKYKQSLERVTNVAGENVEYLNKNKMQNISTIAVEHVSNGHIPHETNPISEKDSSKVLQGESQQEGANTINTHQDISAHNPKPVHSANIEATSKKLAGLRLLDAKVYLNKNEGLTSSSSVTVRNYPNISAPQNSLGSEDVNGDVHPTTHFGDDPQDLPTSKVHPPNYYPGDDLPPLLSDAHSPIVSGSELLALSTSEVHPPKPGTSSELPQRRSDKNGFPEKVTPLNSDIRTPLTGQHTGKVVKNPNYSSFVDALTPARFQQGRKRPLSAKAKILVQCEQQKPMKFTEVLSASALAKCMKVGEGTYGEVYKTNDGVEDVALKVIPIEGNFTVSDEPQKSFEDMIPEIVISKELSNLCECDDVRNAVHVCSNFIKVKRVMLVQDSYPEKLLQEWDSWKNNHNCENERPDMFQSDQYFVVFEFTDGGVDLERFQFNSMEEALSVLQQVAMSLSVAEESLMFEHRDLHWGNVLIKRTKCKKIHYKLCGEDICVKSAGVFVSIIDFTLSRLTKDGMTVYCDLSKDPDIFKGKGDYQFQVYRLMRKANNNDWECHKPYSNVLWIRYLIDKVLNAKKYKKANNSIQRSIRTYLRQVLSYESASQAVNDGFLGLDVRGGL